MEKWRKQEKAFVPENTLSSLAANHGVYHAAAMNGKD